MSWDEETVVKKENSFVNNANISGQESQKSFNVTGYQSHVLLYLTISKPKINI